MRNGVIVNASSRYPVLTAWKSIAGLSDILEAIRARGWTAFIVGGWVRDAVMGCAAKDVDLECFGDIGGIEELAACLAQVAGRVEYVGVSFGVLKVYLPGHSPIDVSLPRREVKVGRGHKGFQVVYDARISPCEAAARRDFTINALMYDPLSDTLYDFYGGVGDIEDGVLRHISPAFAEDPLRVLRGFRFCSRFGLSPAPETVEFCRRMVDEYEALAKERIANEFLLWASSVLKKPSAGLRFLEMAGWAEKIQPFREMMSTPQSPPAHPEGSVWEHTLRCVNAMSRLIPQSAGETERVVLMLAALSHDFGKPRVVNFAPALGKYTFLGHEVEGESIVREFWGGLGIAKSIVERVAKLVRWHLRLPTTRSGVLRLARDLAPATIRELGLLMLADHKGRGIDEYEEAPVDAELLGRIEWMVATAEREQVDTCTPAQLVRGRDLLPLGFPPGPMLGDILRQAYEAQLNGEFCTREDGIRWVVERFGEVLRRQ